MVQTRKTSRKREVGEWIARKLLSYRELTELRAGSIADEEIDKCTGPAATTAAFEMKLKPTGGLLHSRDEG